MFAIFIILSIISFPLKVRHYSISTPKVTEPVRIAQISDLHSEYYGKGMKNLLNALDEQSPDIVVLTGDIFDDIKDNGNTRTFIEGAVKKYPCYYVSGNHEHRKKRLEGFQTGSC